MLTPTEQARRFAAMTLVCLILYFPFLSIQWDLNGIIETQSVEAGGTDLFSPNHMLYRPVSFIILKLWQATGYTGHSAVVLQTITTVAGAVGIGLFFLALCQFTEDAVISMTGAVFLATSWSYWKFSLDVSYIIPAAMLVCAALVLLLRKRQTGWSITAAGGISALAILGWQANIFLMPWFLATILWLHRHEALRVRFSLVARFLVASGIVVGLVYGMASIFLFEHGSLADIAGWVMSHGADGVGRSPIWGRWGADRLLPAASSAIASFIPVWQGLGIRKLLQGEIQPDKILSQLSLVAILALGGWTLFLLFRQRLRNASRVVVEALWFILAYLSFLPFIIWWDPYEPKWFIIPDIFLIVAMSKIWSQEKTWRRQWVVAGCIAIVSIANFSTTIWPDHTLPNPWIQMAECFAGQTTKADTFIPTDWKWFGYAVYFFDYQGQELALKRGEQYQAQNIEVIEQELLRTRGERGHIYAIDASFYSPQAFAYFQEQVGMPIEVLSEFQQSPAFTCGELQFVRISGRK